MKKPIITNTSHGLEVQVGVLVVGYLNFWEGLVYRVTGHIPEWCYLAAAWYDPAAENTMPVHLNLRDKEIGTESSGRS